MKEIQNLFPTPDWRNKDNYTFGERPRAWGWEFLRRGRGYRLLWIAMVFECAEELEQAKEDEITLTPVSIDGYGLVAISRGESWGYSTGNFLLSPKYTWGELDYFFAGAIPHEGSPVVNTNDRNVKVTAWLNSKETKNLVNQGALLIKEFEGVGISLGQRLDYDEAAVVFNLSEPLAPQFDRARNALRKVQQNIPGSSVRTIKFTPDSWAEHLRTYDALMTNFSPDTIAETLWPWIETGQDSPGRKRISFHKAEATRFIESGWKEIMRISR